MKNWIYPVCYNPTHWITALLTSNLGAAINEHRFSQFSLGWLLGEKHPRRLSQQEDLQRRLLLTLHGEYCTENKLAFLNLKSPRDFFLNLRISATGVVFTSQE